MADLRPQYTEEAVGANHPTKSDVINRAYNVEHDEDGIHTYIFTDRGDPHAYDFVVGDFTTDATWNNLDLSSIVPAGTRSVLLNVTIKDDAINSLFQLRENGNSDTFNTFRVRTQVANQAIDGTAIVTCDSGRVLDYYASNLVWTTIDVVVRGWWK